MQVDRERFLADYRRFAARTERREPPWLRPIRETAIARFAETGFPTTREEDWKYTNVSRIVGRARRPAFEPGEPPPPAVDAHGGGLLGDSAFARLLFVNGRFSRAHSQAAAAAGVQIGSLAEALATDGEVAAAHLARHAGVERGGFPALATALFDDGALIVLADGVELDRPIEVVFVSSGDVIAHPRLLVHCGRASRATLLESYLSAEGGALTNAVGEIVLGEGAELRHVRVTEEGPASAQVATTEVAQHGRNSRYRSAALVLGGAFVRHELNVRLAAAGAECSLDGLYLAGGDQFVDNHTAIDHACEHGTSRELYKGVLAGRARVVFNGKVFVRPDAQKTDAQQTNKNLLLSDEAEVDTKPELQILADDVKCAHGAAIGRLDPEALFYLKSRGIGEGEGRRILTRGFVNEVIERIPREARTRLEQRVSDRLERDLVEER